MTPMVRAISDRGAVYTQQRIRELLPQTGLSDAENAARMRQLPTKMRQQIAVQKPLWLMTLKVTNLKQRRAKRLGSLSRSS